MNVAVSRVSNELLPALEKIDRPGSFCIGGRASPVLPGLEVDGIGSIGLPLNDGQAAALAAVCHQAPYGKGEETIVDTNVRCVLELDADQFTLTNPEWQKFLKKTVKTVQQELGLEQQTLQSHLYKLLLYQPGSFFLSHQDGERLDRMVATLVIVLPSAHEGGELIVRHDGQEQTLEFGGTDSPFRLQYGAFYADCEHEIRPVKSGHRLSLVYNLTLAKSKKAITAPKSGEHIDRVASLLGKWTKQAEPAKLAITLDHEYTEKGLIADALKGVDRAKARVLFEAARVAGCRAYLALLTYWQIGAAEGGYDGGYGYRRYDDYDDGDYEMGEVYDSSLTAEHWSDPNGNRLSFGRMGIAEDEVVSTHSLTDGDPEEHFEGFTGNAGMELERWYRQAVIVIWPEKRHFDILCDAGTGQAVAGLGQMVGEGNALSSRAMRRPRTNVWSSRGRLSRDGRRIDPLTPTTDSPTTDPTTPARPTCYRCWRR